MRIGLSFFPVRPSFLLPMARRADELGYDSIWISEHLVFPRRIESQYPYNRTVGAPLPSTPLFDPLITLSFLAAQTKRIRLGTAIYVLALRHPLVAAKLIATFDVLSEGRALLGVGAGWLKEEFVAVDVPWEERGARLDESIEVMRQLWSEPTVAHQGHFFRFEEVGFEPKPVRRSVPVLIGGESPAALRRAARLGDGWLGLRHSPDSASARVRELRAMGEAATPLKVTIEAESLPDGDTLQRYRDAGVDRIMLNARLLSGGEKTIDAALDGLERLSDTARDADTWTSNNLEDEA